MIEGFVDLGPFTTQKDKKGPSDHGLVVLFVLFRGKWNQVIGCFAVTFKNSVPVTVTFLALVPVTETMLLFAGNVPMTDLR